MMLACKLLGRCDWREASYVMGSYKTGFQLQHQPSSCDNPRRQKHGTKGKERKQPLVATVMK
jgi:hypothetical protein